MADELPRPVRAGSRVDDWCAACKASRGHTVFAATPEGRPLVVVCGFCGSRHNWRGGADRTAPPAPLPPVSDRERSTPDVSDLETLLRRVVREEMGLTPVAPAEKWRGGHLVLRPANAALQERSWPIETFFHKVVMLRNRLRVLEQQINGLALPEDEKVRLQGYVTGCYGSLTSFNVLFAEDSDRFRGSGGDS